MITRIVIIVGVVALLIGCTAPLQTITTLLRGEVALADSVVTTAQSHQNTLLLRWTNRATEPVTFEITLVGNDTSVTIPLSTWAVSRDSLCSAAVQYDVPVRIAVYSDSLYQWQVVECSIIAVDSAGNRSLPCPPVRFWDRRRTPR